MDVSYHWCLSKYYYQWGWGVSNEWNYSTMVLWQIQLVLWFIREPFL